MIFIRIIIIFIELTIIFSRVRIFIDLHSHFNSIKLIFEGLKGVPILIESAIFMQIFLRISNKIVLIFDSFNRSILCYFLQLQFVLDGFLFFCRDLWSMMRFILIEFLELIDISRLIVEVGWKLV